jgi:CheY-like chemotaxis protein
MTDLTPRTCGAETDVNLGGAGGQRILIVEDHEDTLEITAKLLRTMSYEVKTASTISAALEAAESERFDILISDISLPDGSGLDLLQLLTRTAPIKGIAMSGYGLESDIERSREAGFLEHLTKPVDLPQLVLVIERLAN